MESNTKRAGGALAQRSTVVRLYNYEIRMATRYLKECGEGRLLVPSPGLSKLNEQC